MNGSDYALLIMPAGFAALGILAQRFGADSRLSGSDPVSVPIATGGSRSTRPPAAPASLVRLVHSGASSIASRAPARATSEPYPCPPGRPSAFGSRASVWARAWTWASSRSAE